MSVPHADDVRRPGFTLVELLVVLAIILTLATIAVLFVPQFQDDRKATRAGDQLQGWLFIAKQRAVRDRIPTGVRLIFDPVTPNLVSSLQYVQQPDPNGTGYYVGGQVQTNRAGFHHDSTGPTDPPGDFIFSVPATVSPGPPPPPDFTGGLSSAPGATPDAYPVLPGDYLQVNRGPAHPIRVVFPPVNTTPASPRLLLATDLGADIAPTGDYVVIRQPRPLAGEAPLQLPQNMVIDLSTSGPPNNTPLYSQNVPVRTITYGLPPNTTTIPVVEIVFSPSGEVIGKGSGNDMIILWVRDVTKGNPALGQPVLVGNPVLVTIHVRTGPIGAYPVDTTSGNYYSYTQNPQSSGL